VTEKVTNRGGHDPYAHAPAVALCPPPRCFHPVPFSNLQLCGELARWERPGNHWFETQYFCDVHRRSSDVPIPDVHLFRRVRVNVDVMFAAVHVHAPIAHTEVIARLHAAVTAYGGLLDINAVRSDVVKSSAPVVPVERNSSPGDLE